jgi:hypothetical protein
LEKYILVFWETFELKLYQKINLFDQINPLCFVSRKHILKNFITPATFEAENQKTVKNNSLSVPRFKDSSVKKPSRKKLLF